MPEYLNRILRATNATNAQSDLLTELKAVVRMILISTAPRYYSNSCIIVRCNLKGLTMWWRRKSARMIPVWPSLQCAAKLTNSQAAYLTLPSALHTFCEALTNGWVKYRRLSQKTILSQLHVLWPVASGKMWFAFMNAESELRWSTRRAHGDVGPRAQILVRVDIDQPPLEHLTALGSILVANATLSRKVQTCITFERIIRSKQI